MTVEGDGASGAEREAQSVRRIFLVALAAAVVAAAVAFSLELTHRASNPVGASTSLLPPTFRQPGFSDGTLRRVRQFTVPAAVQRHVVRTSLDAGTEVYLVATCDRGTVTVRIGALTSSQRCTGHPMGLARVTIAARDARIEASIDRRQSRDWAVGIYR